MEETKPLPLMRRALGDDWSQLHVGVRRHYDLPGAAASELTLEGIMDEVDHAAVAKPLLLLGRAFGALLDERGRNVPVTVRNRGDADALHWHRSFHFTGRAPLLFRSRMQHLGGDEIVEYVRFGLGICMRVEVCDGALRYTSRGYRWQLGPLAVRLPDWLLLGRAVIEERGIDERTVALEFAINHPWWGETFRYCGRFRFATEDALSASR